MAIEIIVPANEKQWQECRNLHREYVQIIGEHPLLKPYFSSKNFFTEIESMPQGYQPPDGICLMAYFDHFLAGTVAVRKLDNYTCEMKRLYVRPEARGTGMGKLLVEKALDEAKHLGFTKMRLDNSKSAMEKANALYKALGFYEIDRYNENFVPDAYFMEKVL